MAVILAHHCNDQQWPVQHLFVHICAVCATLNKHYFCLNKIQADVVKAGVAVYKWNYSRTLETQLGGAMLIPFMYFCVHTSSQTVRIINTEQGREHENAGVGLILWESSFPHFADPQWELNWNFAYLVLS